MNIKSAFAPMRPSNPIIEKAPAPVVPATPAARSATPSRGSVPARPRNRKQSVNLTDSVLVIETEGDPEPARYKVSEIKTAEQLLSFVSFLTERPWLKKGNIRKAMRLIAARIHVRVETYDFDTGRAVYHKSGEVLV